MILAESELSHQAAQETLPLRDAFAVLFFVSVGMLFDPSIIVREPGLAAATFLVIVAGNAFAAFTIVTAFRYPLITALTSAAALSQIGEFSFILAGLGVDLKLLSETGQDLILAGAILSILANPLLFFTLEKATPWLKGREQRESQASAAIPPLSELPVTSLRGHAILVGHGRVGSLIAEALKARGTPFLVVEERPETSARIGAAGVENIPGTAGQRGILEAVNLAEAQWLISAIPNPFEASDLIERAKKANPSIRIVARAHNNAEVEHLRKFGAD
jgi:CPA2 family monovalent cation:H+ antiporter-2